MFLKTIAEKVFGKGKTKKAEDLKSLSDWISETADDIQANSPHIKQKVGHGRFGGCFHYEYSTPIDIAGYSREDLKVLRPALEKLHDVCKQENIAMEIGGFDLLPYKSSVDLGGAGAPSRKNSFMISADARHEYNYAVNPFSKDNKQYGFSAPFFADKNTLGSIVKWIENSTEKIRQMDKEKAEACISFSLIGNAIDIGAFSRNDLQQLRPALEKLHEVCKKNNVAVQMSGFDMLPRTASAGPAAVSDNPYGFWIFADPKREYSFFSNPFKKDQVLIIPVGPKKTELKK